MKNIYDDVFFQRENAVSSVMGFILMVCLTVVLAAAIMAFVWGVGGTEVLAKPPMAIIEVQWVEGGVPDNVRYDENMICLEHMGGDPLELGSTSIVICGQGSSFVGKVGSGGKKMFGDLVVKYSHLGSDGKYLSYSERSPALEDNVWSPGECLLLNGYDGNNTDDELSVFVSVEGLSNTSNHYGFMEGTVVDVRILDSDTHSLISQGNVIVKHAK